MSGTLYLVGTPIGNLGDITERQLEILADVSFIAAEDTRVTRKLLTHFDIHTPLVSYHEHSPEAVIQQITERLAAGESCAVVTDAGMPCISDPGAILVQRCIEQNIRCRLCPVRVQSYPHWLFPDRIRRGSVLRDFFPSQKNSAGRISNR